MKLRWVVYGNTATADQVREYAFKYGVSLQEAKSTLVTRTPPKLQYYDDGFWVDVPYEVLPLNEN